MNVDPNLSELERRGAGDLRHEPLPAGLSIEQVLADVAAAELEVLAAAAPWPIRRECSASFRARRKSGTRRLSAITLGVVHCTQGATARGAASWFVNPAAQGSAHVVADGRECFRTLPPSVIPWGAPGVNGRGWHLELAGFAEWSRGTWLAHRGTLERGAFKLALHGHAFNFPMRRLTDGELRRGVKRGIIGHAQASRVFGGSHTDPGAHFPWAEFLELAHAFELELARV